MSISFVLKAATFSALALGAAACVTPEPAAPDLQPDSNATNAVLRTAAIYVKDLDASLAVYTDYLGYEVMGQQPVTSEKSRQTIGAATGVDANIAYLAPRNDRLTRPHAGNGLALIELSSAADRAATSTPAPARGDIMLVHEVAGIKEMYAAMSADPLVEVLTPLSPSGTGKSLSFAALDPNGIRLEIYEYITKPAENAD